MKLKTEWYKTNVNIYKNIDRDWRGRPLDTVCNIQNQLFCSNSPWHVPCHSLSLSLISAQNQAQRCCDLKSEFHLKLIRWLSSFFLVFLYFPVTFFINLVKFIKRSFYPIFQYCVCASNIYTSFNKFNMNFILLKEKSIIHYLLFFVREKGIINLYSIFFI